MNTLQTVVAECINEPISIGLNTSLDLEPSQRAFTMVTSDGTHVTWSPGQPDITLPQHNEVQIIDVIEDPQEAIEVPPAEVDDIEDPIEVAPTQEETSTQEMDDIEDLQEAIEDSSVEEKSTQEMDDIEAFEVAPTQEGTSTQEMDDIEDPQEAIEDPQEAIEDSSKLRDDEVQVTPEVTRVTECPPAPQRAAPITFVAARRILFERLHTSISDLEDAATSIQSKLNDIRRSRSDGDLPLETSLLADDDGKIVAFDENFKSLKATVSELESLPPSSHKWKANRLMPRIRNPQRSLNRSAVPPREVARLEVEARIFRNYKK
jgi:hypothetical protein